MGMWRRDPLPRRRSGPPGEHQWWVPSDQASAEREVLTRKDLGRGWIPASMVNNVERLRPLGHGPASDVVEQARVSRHPTGLDEGRAWRHRDAGTLLVLRTDVYADDKPGVADAHRGAWGTHGPAALEETWRDRWRERGSEPGWIEARRVEASAQGGGPEAMMGWDWVRVEDHTAASDPARRNDPTAVVVYEYLTIWDGRRQVTAVIRHQLGLDLDEVVWRCRAALTDGRA
jgi:hypothetical protein